LIELIGSIFIVFLISFIIVLKKQHKILKDKHKKILFQKKSSEVKLGYLVEHLAPVLDEFPYNLEDENVILVPLGQPIDYFVVTENEIGFIEIKTGKSALNKRQQLIKKLVNDKKVVWHLIRINPKGKNGT